MIKVNSHYSGMDPWGIEIGMRETATFLIKEYYKTNLVPMLVFTGMSGISHASILAAIIQKRARVQKYQGFAFGMMYVRKPEEKSHGRAIEVSVLGNYGVGDVGEERAFSMVFVDDFLDTGSTFKRCLDAYHNAAEHGSTTRNFLSINEVYCKFLPADESEGVAFARCKPENMSLVYRVEGEFDSPYTTKEFSLESQIDKYQKEVFL